MQINDIISIDIENGKITIKADPELAHEILSTFSPHSSTSHTFKSQDYTARAQTSALDIHDIQKRQNLFRLKSSEIFRHFQEHNNGCNDNKTIALQCIKKEFNLGYGEAKVYVTEGRRLFKAGSAAEKKAKFDNSHTSPVCDSKLIPPKKKRPV